jgi:hypothetical protein
MLRHKAGYNGEESSALFQDDVARDGHFFVLPASLTASNVSNSTL